jgi:hypothetical protein
VQEIVTAALLLIAMGIVVVQPLLTPAVCAAAMVPAAKKWYNYHYGS